MLTWPHLSDSWTQTGKLLQGHTSSCYLISWSQLLLTWIRLLRLNFGYVPQSSFGGRLSEPLSEMRKLTKSLMQCHQCVRNSLHGLQSAWWLFSYQKRFILARLHLHISSQGERKDFRCWWIFTSRLLILMWLKLWRLRSVDQKSKCFFEMNFWLIFHKFSFKLN